MIPLAAVLAFTVAVTPLVLTPGASFTLVSARGLAGDRRGAWLTILGTACGIVLHAVLAGVGLAALVLASAELYRAVRLAGAAYLVGLGVVLLWRARSSGADDEGEPGQLRSARPMTQWWQAFVANVLNVKAATVYLSLAPQFVDAGHVGVPAMVTLAAGHVAVMAAWLGLWSTGLVHASRRVDPRRWTRRIDAVGGAVLVALGVRTAAQAR